MTLLCMHVVVVITLLLYAAIVVASDCLTPDLSIDVTHTIIIYNNIIQLYH